MEESDEMFGTDKAHYTTETYRGQSVPRGLYKHVQFLSGGRNDFVDKAAKLVVDDLTKHLDLGLVIPPNAELSYDG